MKCPRCSALSEVADSRPVDEGHAVKRKRRCLALACGHEWTTLEHEAEAVQVYVPKRAGKPVAAPSRATGS